LLVFDNAVFCQLTSVAANQLIEVTKVKDCGSRGLTMRCRCCGASWTLALVLVGCAGSHPPAEKAKPIFFYAAASTKDVAEQIARDFQAETAATVEINPGPSSGLAKQIEWGGDADLFLSADEVSADYLSKKNLVELRRDLLTNHLVVITPSPDRLSIRLAQLRDLAETQVRRVAMAEPGVPAGEYARQALRQIGILEQMQDKIVGGVDVRATLQFVARGEVDAGLVYLTDAVNNPQVRIAFQVDDKLHAPILYPLVLIRKEHIRDEARKFYDFLGSDKAAKAFRTAHFEIVR
jgi:molybdate transport system substrate-binding protein